MSIEMENPTTLVEKVDAASNHVAQIRLALMTGDKNHALAAVDKAGELLFDALQLIEEQE
jgi:hypothetical protein